MAHNSTQGTIQSGRRLLRVVQALQELDGATVTELADHFDMHRSHVHKYLKTLENSGYVNNDDGVYELSFLFITHGEYVRHRNRLCEVAQDRIEELGDRVEIVVKLSVRQGDHTIVVFSRNEEKMFSGKLMPGKKSYLHQTAPGKAMLAELSDEEISRYVQETGLPGRNENTITDPDVLWEEVQSIRSREYAVSTGEWNATINGVGVSIISPDGTLGAINICGPATGHPDDYLVDEYTGNLSQITSQIEHKLAQHVEA